MFLAYKFESNFSLSECRPGRENSRPEVVLVGRLPDLHNISMSGQFFLSFT